MPVLVTAAHRTLARRLALRFLETGGELRVTTDGDAAAVRAAGAFVATAAADDEGRLEAALADVHTVVHVGGGVGLPGAHRLVEEARVVARAAAGAGVRRLITLSLPGADPGADDPLRRAKAEAEAVLADLACPTIVVRVGLVDTPWLRDALVTTGLARSLPAVEVRPVRLADLLELVVAFDEARSRSADGHLVVAADGPATITLADYVDLVAPSATSTGTAARPSLVGRRLPDEAEVARLRSMLAGPWLDPAAHLVDGWAFAELTPRAPWQGLDPA